MRSFLERLPLPNIHPPTMMTPSPTVGGSVHSSPNPPGTHYIFGAGHCVGLIAALAGSSRPWDVIATTEVIGLIPEAIFKKMRI